MSEIGTLMNGIKASKSVENDFNNTKKQLDIAENAIKEYEHDIQQYIVIGFT